MRAHWIVASIVFVAAACSNSDSGQNPGDDQPAIDAPKPVCGDGVCSSSEINTCNTDCGGGVQPVCGNGVCEAGETGAGCPADCATTPIDAPQQGGTDGGGGALNCADMNTQINCLLCQFDPSFCTGIYTATACAACGGGGFSFCDGGAPDGTCSADEDSTICPEDCP